MSFITIIIFLIIGAVIFTLQKASHERRIKMEVELRGGIIISIERQIFHNGPFFIKGKGKSIYQFIYSVGGETKEGWVRFGGLFGPDWRM